jgi:hypothetical protein
MTGIRCAAALGFTVMLAAGPTTAAAEPDELMPGTIALVRYGVVAKVIARAPIAFDLPDAINSPVAGGASLLFFDTAGADTDVYALPAGGWTGLGVPAGSRGWKYRGSGAVGDPCRVVLVTPGIVKAVCKGRGVQLTPPFVGSAGIRLAVGTKNYCASFGGTPIRNDASLFKAKDASAPAACPTGSSGSTTTSSTVIGASTTSTSIPSGPCCGGYTYSGFISDGVTGDACGTISYAAGETYPLVCGGLYVGGGGNSIGLPLATPNFLEWTVGLANCTGQTATVVPTTSTETGTNLRCTDIGCFFGGPLTIPNTSSTPTSACVLITLAAPASGTMDCGNGTANIDLPLSASIFLTGDSLDAVAGIQPCPLCQGGSVGVVGSGVCNGGVNNGMACTPANTDANGVNGMDPSYPTSHDCPPLAAYNIGSIPIGLSLESDTVSWTGTFATNPTSIGTSGVQRRVFCGYCRSPSSGSFKVPFQQCWENGPVGPACTAPTGVCQQRSEGAFGPGGGALKTIVATGSAASNVLDGSPHDQTMAGLFCIPPTNDPTVNASADLPGPAAATLHGMRRLCPTANPCP